MSEMTTPFFLKELPTDSFGRITPEALTQILGRPDLLISRNVAIYSGASNGADLLYRQTAIELGKRLHEQDISIINGGSPSGLMEAVLKENPDKYRISTAIFYQLSPEKDTTDCITPDFPSRKICFMALARSALGLPGGYGTIEEMLEDLSFCRQRDSHLYVLNLNGYWDYFEKQLAFFEEMGLMPKEYLDHFTFISSLDDFMEVAAPHIESPFLRPDKLIKAPAYNKPTEPTHHYIREHMDELIDAVKRQASFLNTKHPECVPRLGFFASGNMKDNSSRFGLSDSKLRQKACKAAAEIGQSFAKEKALMVISGSRDGLRKIAADRCLMAGGSVVWVAQARCKEPMHIDQLTGKELSITVPRHYEKDMIMGLLCQSYVAISGGIHTADQVFGHVTRNQTGHGAYSEFFPERYDPNAPRPLTYLYDLSLSGSGRRMWGFFFKQIDHCIKEGFMSEKDRELLQRIKAKHDIVAKAVAASRQQSNYLMCGVPSSKTEMSEALCCLFDGLPQTPSKKAPSVPEPMQRYG